MTVFTSENDFWQRIYMEAYQMKRDTGTAKAHADDALKAYKEAFPPRNPDTVPPKGRS